MRKSGDVKKVVVQKKANVFEIGPKKEEVVEEPVAEVKEEPKKVEPVPAPVAAPVMDMAALMQQMAAIQALLTGGVPVAAPVVARDEPAEDVVEEAVEDAVDVPAEAPAEVPAEEVVDVKDDDEVADDETEGSESTVEIPVEVHDVCDKQMILMYKFYRDIFDNFNWMRKFKDDGKLILTPNQLVAFLALVCDIDRSAIRIQCDVKPKKRYSDGKIYKVVKIGIETEKELPDLEKVFKSYNISAEYINYSEKLMSVDY